jgi:hypothetical protein
VLSFLVGVMTGAVATAYWRPQVRGEHLPSVRDRAADSIDAIEHRVVENIRRVSARARSFLRSEKRTTPQTQMTPGTPRSAAAPTAGGVRPTT